MVKVETRQPELSFLQFVFFTTDGGSSKKIKLPFMENIMIKEGQKANYVDYDPIGRAGSLFTYTGSKSRNLKLSFMLTFDNIAAFNDVPLGAQTLFGPFQGEKQFFDTEKTFTPNDSYSAFHKIDDGGKAYSSKQDKTTQLIMYWVNLIRSSTINNVKNPSLPPPLIRLNHGVMYRNIPCICKSYDISYEDAPGYERTSFLPRRLKVSLDLYEVRLDLINRSAIASSIGEETLKEVEVDDNLKGWETVINGGSLDPVTKVVTETEV